MGWTKGNPNARRMEVSDFYGHLFILAILFSAIFVGLLRLCGFCDSNRQILEKLERQKAALKKRKQI